MNNVTLVDVSRPVDILGTLAAPELLTATRVASEVIDVTDFAEVTALIHVDAAAANIVSLIPLMASKVDKPATTAVDEWFVPSITDGSVANGTPAGAALPGSAFSLTNFGQTTVRPMEALTVAATGASDEIRLAVSFRCRWARWFHIQVVEASGLSPASVYLQAVRNT